MNLSTSLCRLQTDRRGSYIIQEPLALSCMGRFGENLFPQTCFIKTGVSRNHFCSILLLLPVPSRTYGTASPTVTQPRPDFPQRCSRLNTRRRMCALRWSLPSLSPVVLPSPLTSVRPLFRKPHVFAAAVCLPSEPPPPPPFPLPPLCSLALLPAAPLFTRREGTAHSSENQFLIHFATHFAIEIFQQ